VVVYTDKPDFYQGLPLDIIDISNFIDEWTLGGKYHFRIKNLVLQKAIEQYQGSIIHLDSDILVEKDLNLFFNLINDKSALLYLNEGSVLKKKNPYVGLIRRESNDFLRYYADFNKINMYGSAVIGISSSMLRAIKQADEFIRNWLDQVDAHTVEQFALSEALIRNGINITPVVSMTTSYSTSGSKAYARKRIEEFFSLTKEMEFFNKLNFAKKWKIRRSLSVWIFQKMGLQKF
jgi:hypothetical protein